MQVFKNYFKILKSSKNVILIYMGIFMLLAVLFGLSQKDNSSADFEQSKYNITIINRDKETELVKTLRTHLSTTCNIIELEDDKETLMDAIFFHQIIYVLIIPEDFTEKFIDGEDIKFEKITIQQDVSINYVEMSINNFISTAKVFYDNNTQNLTNIEILGLVQNSLETQVNVSLSSVNMESNSNKFLETYLNYFVYIFMSIFILGISIVMSSYQDLDTKRRNLAAPISIKKINIQLFLGNMVYTTVSALILIAIGFLIAGKTIFDTQSILFIINALVFSLSALSIGFLIAQFPIKREGVIAISNVVSLGLSFICGAFVPIELISDNIIQIAKFTPSYWFIAANNIIAKSPEITSDIIRNILSHMGIQLLFTIALFTLALVVTKSNRAKEA